jgi:hypothetical protein
MPFYHIDKVNIFFLVIYLAGHFFRGSLKRVLQAVDGAIRSYIEYHLFDESV